MEREGAGTAVAMAQVMRHFTLLTALFLLSSCARADADLSPLAAVEVGEIDDDAAMSRLAEAAGAPPRSLEASLPELSVSLSPHVELSMSDGGSVWRAQGRTSVDLASVRGWVPDDPFAQVELTGPRSFEIVLRDPSEQNTMISGMPLFLTFELAGGAQVEAAVWFRPRLTVEPALGGNGRIRFYAAVKPAWVAGDVQYRGRLAVEPGWEVSVISAPVPTQDLLPTGKLRLGWSFDLLAETLRNAPATVRARATRGPKILERAATLQLRVIRLGLTRQDPREVWPAVCEPSVRACLVALPAGQLDTEACGNYRQVLACGGPDGARDQ